MTPRRAAKPTPSSAFWRWPTVAARHARRLLWPLFLCLMCVLPQGACATLTPGESTAAADTPRSPPDPAPDPGPAPVCPQPDDSLFPPDLPLTSPAAVGTIEGSFAVSHAGQATYTLPLNVPPGRNGMQPSLAITYNSAHGDSVLGMGFSLSGLSAITRCSRNLLEDGVVGGVTYGADALCLDGQHLVLVQGEVPYPNDPFDARNCSAPDCFEYRTHPDSFVRVLGRYEKGLPQQNGPQSFDVFTKASLHLVYGDGPGAANANVLALNNANAAWWIAKSSDRYGNTIEYLYWNDLEALPSPKPPYTKFYTAEFAPLSISYTGHPTVTATRQVSFVYDTKAPTDVRTHYDRGAPLQNTMRLKSILMSEGITTLRTYNFSYGLGQNTHRTLLDQVEECSAPIPCQPNQLCPSVCKPPTTFTWSSAPLGFSPPVATLLPVPESHQASVIPTDVTGDGIPELVVPDLPAPGDTQFAPNPPLWKVALNAGPLPPDAGHSPYFLSPFAIAANEPLPPPANPGSPVAPELGTSMDYNGDGLSDILLYDIHGQHKNWIVLVASPKGPNKSSFTFKPLDTGIPRVFGLGADTPPRLAGPSASAHLADLDGDGVPDLIQCQQVNVGTFAWTARLWDAAGPGFSVPHPLPPISVIYPCDTELYPVDIDSDGLADLVMRETDQDPMGQPIVLNNYVTLALRNSTPGIPNGDVWSSDDLHLPAPAPGGSLVWMDINGDGLPDAVETG